MTNLRWLRTPQWLTSLPCALLLVVACAAHGQPSTAMALDDLGDPLRDVNRAVFRFNEAIDNAVAKPLAQGYQRAVPTRLQWGVSNFFSNIGELQNVLNDLLQGKLLQAGRDSSRFLINTTVGMGGFFDVATRMGIAASDGEDFGQTLAVWGVPQGPYLMLPLLGPSTVRELPSRLVDRWVGLSEQLDDVAARNALLGLQLVDTRAGLLNAEAAVSGDRYLFLQQVYLQRRDFLINDGVVEDDFGDFGEYDDY